MSLRPTLLFRYGVVSAVLLVFAVMIAGRVAYVQLADPSDWKSRSVKFEDKTIVVPGGRGDICADDGRVLVTSLPFYEIRMDLGAEGVKKVFNDEVKSLAKSLSTIFTDRSAWQFEKQLKDAFIKGERYHRIHSRRVSYQELQAIKRFPILERGKYGGGFIIVQDDRRILPHGAMAARTLGLMNKGAYGGRMGSVGISGVEGAFESYLRGGEGLLLQQNLSGRWVRSVKVEPDNGMDVVTTIDVDLQDVVQDALYDQLVNTQADYGTAVLMEVETGDIKAVANLGRTETGEYKETYNYAMGHVGCTEPGSTFKLISLAIALDEGLVDTSSVYDTENGTWRHYDRTIYDSDWRYGKHGPMTVKKIFEKSSNVGTSKVVVDCYKGREKEFIDRLCNLRLDQPLGIGIQGEGVPYVKYPGDKDWWGTTLAYMSHGYEVKMTPLQVLTYYNAVANNGQMVRPKLVRSVNKNGEIVKRYDTELIKNSICSDETLGKLRAMLEGVVQNGTARSLKNDNYTIAGKTGTAVVALDNQGYSKNGKKVYQASFAGYFPAEKPRYSCIVVVSNPRGRKYYGGSVAGPVFREIADYIYVIDDMFEGSRKPNWKQSNSLPVVKKGILADTKSICTELGIDLADVSGDVVDLKLENGSLKVKTENIAKGRMPNLMGMGASDVVYLIEKAGMTPKIKGFGTVKEQFPKPGDVCRKGQTVYLVLS